MKNESAFKLELVLFLVSLPIAFFVTDSTIMFGILVTVGLVVLIVEAINTAIEVAIDRISLEFHPMSKTAKDLGSLAVFLSLLNAIFWWALAVASAIP